MVDVEKSSVKPEPGVKVVGAEVHGALPAPRMDRWHFSCLLSTFSMSDQVIRILCLLPRYLLTISS